VIRVVQEPGNYEIRVEELRGATTKDRQLIPRLAGLARAVHLGNEANDLESKRKYSEAEPLLLIENSIMEVYKMLELVNDGETVKIRPHELLSVRAVE
jgi:hypothetical protein